MTIAAEFRKADLAAEPRQSPPRALNVAVLDEELPYPTNTGKRLRTYHLLTRLAQRHRLRFVSYRNQSDAEYREARLHFESLGIECLTVDHALPQQSVLSRSPVFFGKLAWNLLQRDPFVVAKQYSRAMQQMVDRIAAAGDVDLWHCEWTPYAQFFRRLPNARSVVAAHNVESLIWQRYFENERNLAKKWYIKEQWRKLANFEAWAFGRATMTIAVSQPDADIACREFAAKQVEVVENGVDLDRFAFVDAGRDASELLFTGSLDWRPNLDGLVQFLDCVMPILRKRSPKTHLTIVGRRPPQWFADRVAQEPQVALHADVPSVQPYLERAGLMVVPLRIGGGSRLKIIEAAAKGLPVVSTLVGAEGLTLVDGVHFGGAQSIEVMADSIFQLQHDSATAQKMAAAARHEVEQTYGWDSLSMKQERVWQRAARC